MAELPHVVVLGGGPAGVGGAYRLRALRRARVTLVEQNQRVGGNAGSIEIAGQRVDFGSHRLHPACDPEVLADIRRLLGPDLLDRPRHGRISLRGRWIHFPLKPLDLLLHLDPAFAAGTLRDAVRRPRFPRDDVPESFASVLRENLGPTICREFYFPYARKIWGLEPEQLSPIQARRRVSAGSFRKLARKVTAQVPGLKPPGAGRFFYPRQGYGQISEAYADAARAEGAQLRLGARVVGLEPGDDVWSVRLRRGDQDETLRADYVWSTLPVSLIPRLVDDASARALADAAAEIDYRAMLLVYLTLETGRFTEYDAHYFPSADVSITRLSEPKNYAGRSDPAGTTTLCAELPCGAGDAVWSTEDAALGQLVAEDLGRAGIPLRARVQSVTVHRLRHAYPIYRIGYDEPFGRLDRWVDALPRFLSYGRQGLFAHDNTHHALYMAYAAANCLVDGRFDSARWAAYREVFATHVVED